MKSLYLFFFLFCLSVAASFAAQPPKVLNLQQNQTIDLSKFAAFDAIPNDTTARKMSMKILLNDPRQTIYAKTMAVKGTESRAFDFAYDARRCFMPDIINISASGDAVRFCRDVDMNMLPNQQYLLELNTYDQNGEFLAQSYTTFFTGNQPLQPMALATFSPGPTNMFYVTSTLPFDWRFVPQVPVQTQANTPNSVLTRSFLFDKKTGQRIRSYISCGGNGVIHFYNGSFPYGSITEVGLEIQCMGSDGQAVSYAYYTFRINHPTQGAAVFTDETFVYPAQNQTNVPLDPVFQFQNPKNEFSLPSYFAGRFVEIRLIEEDNTTSGKIVDGSFYSWSYTGETTYTGEPVTPAIASWRPSIKLKPHTKYHLVLLYFISGRGPTGQRVSFTTGDGTVPAEPALQYPASNATLDLCGKKVLFIARANDTTARALSLRVFINDPRQRIAEQVKPLLTPTDRLSDQPFNQITDKLVPGQQYLAEIATLDANGQLIKHRYITFFTSVTGTANPYPQPIAPSEGASNVSLTPAIAVQPPTIPFCGEGLREVFYALDKYPADWTGKDYQSESKLAPADYWSNTAASVYQWMPSQPLAPNTMYQARVIFHAPGAQNQRNPLDYATTFTFTTGSSSAPRLARAETGSSSIAMPNPFSDELTIQLDKKYTQATVQLISMDGRSSWQQTGSALKPVTFKGNSLAPGLYLIRITDPTGKSEQFKVIKQ